MHSTYQFEHSASRSRVTDRGESSQGLCDRLSRTRDFSQRQLPTDHDYANQPANIRLINRRFLLTRLSLALCSNTSTNHNTRRDLDRSLHISP
jgi:hypothetical protein